MRWVLSDGLREYDFLAGGNIYLAPDGITLPIPGQELTYLESSMMEGRRRVGAHHQNGEGSFRVHFQGPDNTTFWAAVDDLQELVRSADRQGGTITYEPGDGAATVTWDLVAIRVAGLPENTVHSRQRHGVAEITFETRPHARLEERQLAGPIELAGPISGLTVKDVQGQVDALGDLTLTDKSTRARRFVEVGVQEHFNPEFPEPLVAQAMVDLTPRAGQSQTRTGSISTNVIRGLANSTAVSALCDGNPMPHQGIWKIRARIYSTLDTARIRLAWRVGSGAWSRERWIAMPAAAGWYDLDLGTINIKAMLAGHSWTPRIETRSLKGLPAIDVDCLSFIPADRYFCGRGNLGSDIGSSPVVASDDFTDSTDGTLNGQAPQIGAGTWTVAPTSDLTVSGDHVIRQDGNDSGPWSGCYARCGTGITAEIRTQLEFQTHKTRSATSATVGVFARYKDANNWIMARVSGDGWGARLSLTKRVSGTIIELGSTFTTIGVDLNLELAIGTDGIANVFVNDSLKLQVDCGSQFRPGGVLEEGGYGFYDYANLGSDEHMRREFYSFVAFVPAPSLPAIPATPAIQAGQSIRLLHDRALTENGSMLGNTPIREGEYLRVPPATRTGGISRIVVRARRNDIGNGEPDEGLADKLEATLGVTERVTLGRA